MPPLSPLTSLELLRWTSRNPSRKMTLNFQPPTKPKVNRNEFLSLVLLHKFSVFSHHDPNIKVQRSPEVRVPQRSAQFPQIDHPSNFHHNPYAPRKVICIKHRILWSAAIIWRAKNDPLRTHCELTSPLLEEFPVLALLDSERVVLGSSKVSFAI